MRVIGGTAKGRILKTEKGEGIRPTSDKVKEALFNILGPKVVGANFLDLFAGSGSVGIESLSRGASYCVFVEKNTKFCRIIMENLNLTGLRDRACIIRRNVFTAIKDLHASKKAFDIIFMDPPYNKQLVSPVLKILGESKLLIEGGLIVVEHHFFDKGVYENFAQIEMVVQKRYGDTALTFLK